jgi:hypothetical protein
MISPLRAMQQQGSGPSIPQDMPALLSSRLAGGCLDPEVAIRTAAALTGPADGTGEMQFWLERAIFAIDRRRALGTGPQAKRLGGSGSVRVRRSWLDQWLDAPDKYIA